MCTQLGLNQMFLSLPSHWLFRKYIRVYNWYQTDMGFKPSQLLPSWISYLVSLSLQFIHF